MKGCHVMAKPTSSKCDLDCSDCFYLEKPQQHYGLNTFFLDSGERYCLVVEYSSAFSRILPSTLFFSVFHTLNE